MTEHSFLHDPSSSNTDDEKESGAQNESKMHKGTSFATTKKDKDESDDYEQQDQDDSINVISGGNEKSIE